MSRFHLIAPSGYCINQQAAALGVQRLELQGHQVDNRGVITRRDQRFAGQESERLHDLNAWSRSKARILSFSPFAAAMAQAACWKISTGRALFADNNPSRCLSADTAILRWCRWAY
jgi:hypothetical protein